MTALLYLLGVLVAILAILVSLGLHEFGHLVPAKLFGAKVTQYFFGFGPTLWSFRRGETEYGLKPVPLGAFVKIVGVVPPYGGQSRSGSTGMFSQLIHQAREAEWEEIEPEDEPRLFYKLSWWKKAVVYAGGVTMNLLLAFVFFGLAFMVIGVQEPSTTVGTVSRCAVQYDPQHPTATCRPGDPVSPAHRAGLRPGDRVVAFNGVSVTDWSTMQRLIRGNADRVARITVVRAGERKVLTTRTLLDERPSLDNPRRTVRVGFLGLSPGLDYVRKGPGFVLDQMVTMTGSALSSIAQLPVKIYHVALAIAHVEKRDPNGPIGLVGMGRTAGDIASNHQIEWKNKTFLLLSIIGGFNLFIGVLNLVPLPPLDGASFAGSIAEGVRRGWRRMRGRRAGHWYFDVTTLLPVTYVVVLAMVAMFLILTVADVFVPVSLF